MARCGLWRLSLSVVIATAAALAATALTAAALTAATVSGPAARGFS